MREVDVNNLLTYVGEFLDKNDYDVSKYKRNYSFRSRKDHTYRVYKWCLRLIEQENYQLDEESLIVACIFHDI